MFKTFIVLLKHFKEEITKRKQIENENEILKAKLKLGQQNVIKAFVDGNTNTVYINPLNSLRFVLNELKKDKINLDKNFYVFTGSTVGVVAINGKGLYTGKIDKLGSVKAIIN